MAKLQERFQNICDPNVNDYTLHITEKEKKIMMHLLPRSPFTKTNKDHQKR